MIEHISCRVPWHDNNWNGCICDNPYNNTSCLRCKAIFEGINKDLEYNNASKTFNELDCETNNFPCIREGAAFLCNKEIKVSIKHPYSTFGGVYDKLFSNLLPVDEILPPYSYPAVPYKWLMQNPNGDIDIKTRCELEGINYDAEKEEKIVNTLNKTDMGWTNHGDNQEAIFNSFYKYIIERQSLMFFYSKQIPEVEENNRILIGIGHVLKVNKSVKFPLNDNEGIESSYTWETMIEHSIRNDYKDGFVFPFDRIKQASNIESFDIEKAYVKISDDFFEEFSYKTEKVSYEGVIDTLIKCKETIQYLKDFKLSDGKSVFLNAGEVLNWLNAEIKKAWEERGEFPGLGAALYANGLKCGKEIARQLNCLIKDRTNYWDKVNDIFNNYKEHFDEIYHRRLHYFIEKRWKKYYLDKKFLLFFDLMSRIDLQIQNAKYVFDSFIDKKDEIIKNPYRLYEFTYNDNKQRISLKKLDYAMLHIDKYTEYNPINNDSEILGDNDYRRIRAYLIYILYNESFNGNTIYPLELILKKLYLFRSDIKCSISLQDFTFEDNEKYYSEELNVIHTDEGEIYYQLKKYNDIGNTISSFVKNSCETPIKSTKDEVYWRKEIDSEFGENSIKDNKEERARIEKSKALEKIFNNKISLLIGGAGTGKTTVLSILCKDNDIKKNGILLLAPTGKAAVRMQQAINLDGKNDLKSNTIASFLSGYNRYNEDDGYTLSSSDKKFNEAKIVIIDECSMLTEDMLASVIYTVKDYIDRVILVGDEKQLPPIGAGRPFYDIIEYFKNSKKNQNLAILTIERRKNDTGKDRNDTKLAECFANEYKAKDIQNVINEIIEDKENKFLCYINNNDLKDFESAVFNAMADATKITSSKGNFIINEHRYMNNSDDINGFNLSIGQSLTGTYFNEKGYFDEYGCASFADNWQILTPTKRNEIGTLWINSRVHEKYKQDGIKYVKDSFEKYKYKSKLPLPVGAEQIIYGEKVIQNKNYNIKKKTSNYKERIANGELGITCHMKGKYDKDNTLNVEFSDRLGDYFCYYPSVLNSDNAECILELAYALTIHKVQGSQFKNVVVILKKESKMLSKELIYTALTRHQDKIWIIGDNNLQDIKKYVSDEYSELAKRFTNLFYAPKIRIFKEKYYEDRLIQIGTDNQKLRSKSEVIVWDKLKEHEELSVVYEEQFENTTLIPDFTIINNKTNKKYIWEHLGLVNDIDYMNHWKWKEKIYKAHGYSKELGNLIVSKDEENGGIDSTKIDNLINLIW